MLGIWLEIPQLESEVLHLILAPFASKNFKVCQMVGLVEEKVKKNSFVAPCRDALRFACCALYMHVMSG